MKRHPTLAAVLAACLAGLLASTAEAQETVTAVGRVVDAAGNPIPDVQVLLDYKGHVVQKYRTKTDKRGIFTHVSVYAGPYRITLKKEDVGEVSLDFNIQALDSLARPPEFKLVPPPSAAPPPGSGLAPAGSTPAVDMGKLTSDIDTALALSKDGKVDEAIAAYESVLARVPDIPLVHYNLGGAYKKKGDVAKAEASFRRSVELDPRFVDGYVALATVQAEGGRRDDAIATIQQGVAQNDPSGRLQYALGVLTKGAGRNAEAKAAFLKALELDPPNYDSHYQLAGVYVSMGDTASAVAELDKFLAAAPADHPDAAVAKSLLAALKK
jgi:tetratricopeptide (TPR) repeat protein